MSEFDTGFTTDSWAMPLGVTEDKPNVKKKRKRLASKKKKTAKPSGKTVGSKVKRKVVKGKAKRKKSVVAAKSTKRKRISDEKMLQESMGAVADAAELASRTHAKTRKPRPVGKWFPNATRVPGAKYPGVANVALLLFYQYVEPVWTSNQQQRAIDFSVKTGTELNLGGRLRIACEGFNGLLTGTITGLTDFAKALKTFDPNAFSETHFKYIEGLPLEQKFSDLSVFPVSELVHYGLNGALAPSIAKYGGEHLDPISYHEKMQEPNTVMIDVRNTYESVIGHFCPPEEQGGAKWLDPRMRYSTDFPGWLQSEDTKQQLKGKQVLMYCTGGVRCERASALLRKEYGNDVGDIFQLKGGIEMYMKQYPEGGFWKGKNFTFDKRNAVGAYGKQGNSDGTMGECSLCAAQCDEYVGKRKCAKCAVPVIVCDTCRNERRDKDPEMAAKQLCPLCQTSDYAPEVLPGTDVGLSTKKQKKKRKTQRADRSVSTEEATGSEQIKHFKQQDVPSDHGAASKQVDPQKKKKKKKTQNTAPEIKRRTGSEKPVGDKSKVKKRKATKVTATTPGDKPTSTPSTSSQGVDIDDNNNKNPTGATRFFVGNLPFDMTEDKLKAWVQPANLAGVQWLTDKSTGKFYGSCFVMCKSANDGALVLGKNQKRLQGRKIRINIENRKGFGHA